MLKQYTIDQLFPQMSNLYGSSRCSQVEVLPMEKNFAVVFPRWFENELDLSTYQYNDITWDSHDSTSHLLVDGTTNYFLWVLQFSLKENQKSGLVFEICIFFLFMFSCNR